MEIVLSKYAGFCEGVARAYDMIEKIAKDPSAKRPIFVLGSLVHNSDVVAKIESMGVKKISVENDLIKSLEKYPERIGTLVITAHGIGPEIYGWAKGRGTNIADTTCPKVIKVQKLAEIFSKKGREIVIVGEKNHKEVRGIYEWAGEKAFFVETDEDLDGLGLDGGKKIAVIAKTTENRDFFKRVAEKLSEKYPNVEVIDTICQATHHRQAEIKKLAEECDVAVVIGSPESANSTRLWEIAKEINPKSYFIQRAEEIEREWFRECEKVAVTAGASTPGWVIDEVILRLRSMDES